MSRVAFAEVANLALSVNSLLGGQVMHRVYTFTDPGLDPDDILSAWLMVRLQQRGLIQVLGMTANFAPPIMRGRLLKGALNILGAREIPVAIGSDCNSIHSIRDYEFDFPLASSGEILNSALFQTVLNMERLEDRSLTLVLISGLTDIAEAIEWTPNLLKRKLKEVYIMGGASWGEDSIIADPTASNNVFDKSLDPQQVYDFFVRNQIPLRILTRHAAYAAPITPEFYKSIQSLNPVGDYLHRIQEAAINSLWQHANSNPSDHRQNRAWFCRTFCDQEDLPISAQQNPWRFVKKLAIYDPLTTLWVVYPQLFDPSERIINGVRHQIVGLSPEQSGVPDAAKIMDALQDLLLSVA